MEIVLLEDVKALGKKGQIVKVNDGYARNFILPKKLGVEATSKNLNDLKLKKANEEKLAAQQPLVQFPVRRLQQQRQTSCSWRLIRRSWFFRSLLRPLEPTRFP